MEGIEGNGHSETAIPGKSLFRIGEVSRVTSTKPFVLRYWETEFPTLQPVKSPKGHRLYRREDIETVFTIKRLLYDEGFTIAGARRHLRDQVESVHEGPDARNAAVNNGTDGGALNAMSVEPRRESAAPARSAHLATLDRKTLLDLRESLVSLLTLLESE